eukprot:TRINITY_DN10201_c0_g1_i1.p1 TRINITY_DN10201_c0_g1~~TRINITY_DN10201_c0_g1_i1.p1  ORF type:complete len:248 (+),score=-9.04 TRINITY_DN10201_c0_g1_i1:341-1084(+)
MININLKILKSQPNFKKFTLKMQFFHAQIFVNDKYFTNNSTLLKYYNISLPQNQQRLLRRPKKIQVIVKFIQNLIIKPLKNTSILQYAKSRQYIYSAKSISIKLVNDFQDDLHKNLTIVPNLKQMHLIYHVPSLDNIEQQIYKQNHTFKKRSPKFFVWRRSPTSQSLSIIKHPFNSNLSRFFPTYYKSRQSPFSLLDSASNTSPPTLAQTLQESFPGEALPQFMLLSYKQPQSNIPPMAFQILMLPK